MSRNQKRWADPGTQARAARHRALRSLLGALAAACFTMSASGCSGALHFAPNPDAAQPQPRLSCESDADCRLPSLHCDLVSRTCVACRGDPDCIDPHEPRCDAALHRCVECGRSEDCAMGDVCEPTTRRCVVACTEGQAEHVCPADAPTCDEVAKICIQCRGDADCQNSDDGGYCDEANGRCVQCVDDRHCSAPSPRCDRTRGRCGQCISDEDCPAGRICDLGPLRCI